MHDVVKPKTVDQMQKPRNRWIKPAVIIVILAAAIFGLVKLGQPMMLIVIAVVSVLLAGATFDLVASTEKSEVRND